MALASSVSGDGKLLSHGNDMGSYSQTITSKRADGTTRTRILTTSYTDIRSERKWYALTEDAINTWVSANGATTNFTATRVNEVTNAWELVVQSVVRTITGYSLVDAPEQE